MMYETANFRRRNQNLSFASSLSPGNGLLAIINDLVPESYAPGWIFFAACAAAAPEATGYTGQEQGIKT